MELHFMFALVEGPVPSTPDIRFQVFLGGKWRDIWTGPRTSRYADKKASVHCCTPLSNLEQRVYDCLVVMQAAYVHTATSTIMRLVQELVWKEAVAGNLNHVS